MSLIEALVAFGVMALAMLGVIGTQTTLRFNSDIAKQRSEATRIAQEHIERWRAFTAVESTPGRVAYSDIADTTERVSGYTTNTQYTLAAQVQQLTDRRDVTVTVHWRDRHDQPQSVVLTSVIAGIDPALSGVLSLQPNGSPHRSAHNRHAGIPIDATELGDGTRRSAYRPPGGANVHWVLDHATGQVTEVCTGATSSRASGCTATLGQIVTGTVRFDTDGEVSAAQAEDPRSSRALHLEMSIALTGGDTTHTECFDTMVGDYAVRYACLVRLGSSSAAWSGTLNVALVGRTLGHAAEHYRVCRYSADYNGRNGIENIEHPRTYIDVSGPLTNQNFLVVRGDNPCPSDVAANPAQGDVINSNTVEHAPNPASGDNATP